MWAWLTRCAAVAVLGVLILGIGIAAQSKTQQLYDTPAVAGPLFEGFTRHDIERPPSEGAGRVVSLIVPPGIDPKTIVPEDFKVKAQILTQAPATEQQSQAVQRSVVFLIDNSMSMVMPSRSATFSGLDLPASDPSYQRVSETKRLIALLKPDDEVAVGCFPPLRDPKAGLAIEPAEAQILQGFTAPNKAGSALDQLKGKEGGGTPLYRAMIQGALMLQSQGSQAKILVILTDGEDTDPTMPLDEAASEMKAFKVHTFVIALGKEPDVKKLSQLAENVVKVEDSKDLNGAFDQLAQRMQSVSMGSDVSFTVQDGQGHGPVVFVDKKGTWRGIAQ